MGALGAAIGTIIAPAISVLVVLVLILRKKTHIQWPTTFTIVPDLKLLRTITQIGVPAGVQGVVLNLGGVFLMKYINHIGDSAVLGAYTFCYLQIFDLVSWTSFGLRAASATLMGQNISAKDPDRGKRAVLLTAGLGGLWAAALGALFWFVPAQLIHIFGNHVGIPT